MSKLLSLRLLAWFFALAGWVQLQADEEWIELGNKSGEALYAEKCGMCHRDSGMGTTLLARRYDPELAVLENRRDLQSVFVETVVRNGFNNMFPISRGEVSDKQLQEIARYLSRNDQ
jgi:mono/diheme cytochrome c family protein